MYCICMDCTLFDGCKQYALKLRVYCNFYAMVDTARWCSTLESILHRHHPCNHICRIGITVIAIVNWHIKEGIVGSDHPAWINHLSDLTFIYQCLPTWLQKYVSLHPYRRLPRDTFSKLQCYILHFTLSDLFHIPHHLPPQPRLPFLATHSLANYLKIYCYCHGGNRICELASGRA
jgi:hypothetical protein